jgi:hypothetical protein
VLDLLDRLACRVPPRRHPDAAAPIGAFGAMAFTIGKYGVGVLVNLGGLVATFYLTSLLFVIVVLGTVARAARLLDLQAARLSQGRAAARARHVLVRSGAAQPDRKLEAAGCDKGVVGLVVPTGYSFNLDGTNIYMTLAALFIAQACGVDLVAGAAAPAARRGDAQLEGRRRGDRRRLHHAGRDAVDRAVGAGRRHGADPRCRPLHERVPQPHQFRRQCRRDDRRRAYRDPLARVSELFHKKRGDSRRPLLSLRSP